MKKLLLHFSFVVLFATSAVASAQTLYPVQGPLSKQTPPPVIKGKIRRPLFSAGPAFDLLTSWTISNGEVLNGKVEKAKANAPDIVIPTMETTFPQSNLAGVWDAVYGDGYFVAHILGNTFYQGVFKSDQGTFLQVESMDGEHGVAADNRGNIYKFVY